MRLDKEKLKKCPNILSKEQLIKVGHMSKRTASYLLESKLLPSKNNGKKTRCYEIKKNDVIAFFNDYSVMPEKYATPPKWYSERKHIRTRPFRLRFSADNYDDRMLHSYYKRSLAVSYSGVLTLADVSDFTGYGRKTVSSWIRKGFLEAIRYKHSFIIPQEFLLTWLMSEKYNDIARKSTKHLNALWGVCE